MLKHILNVVMLFHISLKHVETLFCTSLLKVVILFHTSLKHVETLLCDSVLNVAEHICVVEFLFAPIMNVSVQCFF